MQSMLEKMENMTKELEKRDTLLEKAEVRAKEVEKLAKHLSQVDAVNMEMATQPHSSELAPAVSQVRSNNHLDIAPITPLLLRNSPPLPYDNPANDDMYMGDSESDRRKERRNRKAAKKRNAPRREKTRMNRQREENSDDSDTTIKSVNSDGNLMMGLNEERMVEEGLESVDNSENESYKRKRKAVKKGKAPQREEENSDGNLIIGSDEDRMVEEGLNFDKVDEDYEVVDEDYEVVDADMASP